MHDFDAESVYYQQDDAPSHASGKTITLLQENFPSILIFCFGDIDWPLYLQI